MIFVMKYYHGTVTGMKEKDIILFITVRNTSIKNLGKLHENKKAWRNIITLYDSVIHSAPQKKYFNKYFTRKCEFHGQLSIICLLLVNFTKATTKIFNFFQNVVHEM